MRPSLTRLLALALAITPALHAQFSSGSTGSDGALSYTTAGTTYTFDPVALGLNPAGDNVFNFTTITIAANVTLLMPADVLRNRAVIWLATGNVVIAGTLALEGAGGAAMSATNPGQARSPAMPGPGGYPGGVGAYLTSPATNGGGLGGGVATTTTGGAGGYSYTSNQLVPLVGGSGGAGGQVTTGTAGGNGGAGGGAIRIVSSTSIAVSGAINAYGGAGGGGVGAAYAGGAGSGGAIHLIAPTVTNTGTLNASGGNPTGVIKVSANTANIGGAVYYNAVIGPLYNPPLPVGVSLVKVVSVNGIAAPADVTGSALLPDFTVSTATAVSVNISAQYIPVGTVVKLYLSSEQGNDSIVTCPALAGTLASSTATCTGATFPQGITITDIRAIW
jgi:hypothetical protein